MLSTEWSREVLLEKWMKDPVECCKQAGVQAPSSVLHHGNNYDSGISPDNSNSEESCTSSEITVSIIDNIK